MRRTCYNVKNAPDPETEMIMLQPGISLATIRDILAILAIVIGGTWTLWKFVRERQHYVSANVELGVEHRATTNGRTLVRVTLHIRNIGRIIMRLDKALVYLQHLEPWDEESLRSLEDLDTEIQDEMSPVAEADWAQVDGGRRIIRFSTGQKDIEPGEEDEIPFEFLVPQDTKLMLVYGYIRNSARRGYWNWEKKNGRSVLAWRSQELGWSRTMYYSMPDERVEEE